jgi:hypothetical protein
LSKSVEEAFRKATFAILDEMEILDQKRAFARSIAQYFSDGCGFAVPEDAPARERRCFAPP